jgi:hypothetical protein
MAVGPCQVDSAGSYENWTARGPLVSDACPNASTSGPRYGGSVSAAEPDYSAATRQECQWHRLPLP